MDIKSKSWKAVVSFICFALGSILLLVSVLLAWVGFNRLSEVRGAFQDDYQKSEQFQWQIENTLYSLLRSAQGGGNYSDGGSGVTDPNLPCEVWVDGKREYLSNPKMPLFRGQPEDYNFYLHFDGKNFSVVKDGKAMEWPESARSFPWPAPATEEKQIDIYLAAPAVPLNYVGQYSLLYNIPKRMEQIRLTVLAVCAVPAAGVLFFLIYILMRKHKKRADMTIAETTGRIWAEFKAAALAFMLLLFLQLGGRLFYYPASLFLLPFLALIYLGINDLRYNGWSKIIRQSLCGMLLRLWRCDELKRPVEKRLQRRAVAIFVTMCPFALMSMWWGWVDLCPWALFYSTDRQGMFIFVPLALLGAVCLLAQIYFLRQTMADAHMVNEGMEEAFAERMRSERMKVELITNVSHDLKTPLTSIISYVELLSREEGLPDHVNDYISILGEKSQRLKTMVQEVFEVSKAATGNLPLDLDEIDLCKLIRQTLADMAEPIEESGLTVREQLVDTPVPIRADGDKMYRVFQNLIQNALQYSLEGSRIYVTLETDGGRAVATVRNTSRDELSADKEFTGRFVRGDESRTDGGSGLGLSIAKTFTEACGGSFKIETAADLFTAIVEFPTER